MKRKQLCSLITVALMATTLVMPNNVAPVQAKEKTSVAAAAQSTSGLDVKYEPQQGGPKDIQGVITITNNSSDDYDLASNTIKYFFTDEAKDYKKEFRCNHCGLTEPNGYTDLTRKVTAEFKANPNAEGSDDKDMCEIKIGGGILKPGQKVTLTMNFHVEGWNWQAPDFDQSNDYSFTNKKVELIKGEVKPDVNLNTEEYEQQSKKEVIAKYSNGKVLGIKENGKTLSSSNYTDNGSGNVIFKNSYLDSLSEGDYTYTFVFENNIEVTKVLKIKPYTPPEDTLTIDVADKVEGKPGEEVLVPFEMSKNTMKIKDFKFTVKYDASKLELKKVKTGELTEDYGSFVINDKTENSGRVVFTSESEDTEIDSDGVAGYLVFKIKDDAKEGSIANIDAQTAVVSYEDETGYPAEKEVDAKGGSVSIGIPEKLAIDVADKVEGKPGEEVLVPFEMSKNTMKIKDFKFTVKYDASKLELKKVKTGELTEDYGSFVINDKTENSGRVVFTSESEDTEIDSDGVAGYLVFKIKDDAKEGSIANIDAQTAVVSYEDETGYPAEKEVAAKGGSVSIGKPQGKILPKLDKTNDVFDKDAPSDISFEVTENDYKFKEVSGLTEGSDYVKDGNKLIIKKEYLANQTGTKELVLKFAEDVQIKVNIKIEGVETKDFMVNIDNVTASAGSVVDIPIKVKLKKSGNLGGVRLCIRDTDSYVFENKTQKVKKKNKEIIKQLSFIPNSDIEDITDSSAFDYVQDSEEGNFSVIEWYPNSSAISDGEYEIGTIKLKVDSKLASGTVVPIDVTDVTFGTVDGKQISYGLNIGNIIIK